ncbi:MAG: YihY/virulence factor BrkB family protein, partial [Bacteroidota bacterium]
MTVVGKILQFLKVDVWKIPIKKLPRKKSYLIKQLRIILLTFKGFDEDKCAIRASALTFYSVLSIVPVIAMIFAISKGFGFEDRLEALLTKSLQGQEEVLNWIWTFAQSAIESAKGGLLAGIGIVILLWSVMKVLGNIEQSFNDIWEVKKSRVFVRKLTDYTSIIIIAPIFIILSSSATVFISTFIKNASTDSQILSYIGPVITFLMRLLPYLLIILLLTFLYMVLPNTKVKFKSAFMAGLVAGILFQLAQWGYVNFQVGVAKYNAIYGSFAALPLFLIWMQLSWLIVLFGAELSFANQNVEHYEFEVDTHHISLKQKKVLSLLIANLVIGNFRDGKPPYNSEEISNQLDLPTRLVNNLIFELVESGIFSEIKIQTYKDCNYQPAIDINKLSVAYIISKLEDKSKMTISPVNTDEFEKINEIVEGFNLLCDSSEKNV